MDVAGKEIPAPSLLIVEDDATQRKLLQRLLSSQWDVFLAADIPEAEQHLALQPQIGILVCDHELPGESGLSFCQRLHARNSPLLRILVTGYTRVDLLMQALNSACLFRFISKPFSREQLLEILHEAKLEFQTRETALRERLLLEEPPDKTPSARHRLSNILQIIFGVGSFALATVVIVLLVTLLLGAFVFVLLYILKSTLGIDIFSDSHLGDFLRFAP